MTSYPLAEALAEVDAVKAERDSLIAAVKQAAYTTAGVSNVFSSVKDTASALAAIEEIRLTSNHIAARGEERETELRQIRADRAAFRRYVGLPEEG